MTRRLIGVAVAALMVAALGGGNVAQAHTKKWESDVEADFNFPSKVFGEVGSSKAACVGDRNVRLIHVSGETGEKTPAGATQTRNNGRFSIEPKVVPVPGDSWIVKVLKRFLKKNRSHFHLCKKTSTKFLA